MRTLSRFAILAAAMAAAPLCADPSASAPPVQVEGGAIVDAKDANPMICQRIQEIGSRLRAKKICMLKSEWEEQRRTDRANIERSQVQRGLQPAG